VVLSDPYDYVGCTSFLAFFAEADSAERFPPSKTGRD